MSGLPLPAFYRPIVRGTVGSTNEDLKRYARAGAEEGTLVVAERQTAGRGRRGRDWISPAGNLYASLLLRPGHPAGEALQVSFVAAVALAEAIAACLPPTADVRCKWPNDVLVDDRKVAGLLLESEADDQGGLAWLIVGAGVNIVSFPPLDDAAYPATSLHAAGATGIDAAAVLSAFGEAFLAWHQRWQEEGFSRVRAAWRQRAAGLGETITVRLESETVSGAFLDLDADGALLLGQATQGVRRITAGDVFLTPTVT
jgi:BirA family biotin operon repressor/biotin-[acetyl-CoA-carboxylase] ligase